MSVLLPSSTLPAVVRRSRSLEYSAARNSSMLKWPFRSGSTMAADILEVALALFDFHGAFAVVIDDAILALGVADSHQLGDDFRHRVGCRAYRAAALLASQRPHTDPVCL